MREKNSHAKLNNYGLSLVELIVVIAIMGILVGGASMGISIVFSKDAAKCATSLNEAIYTTRMKSMSKVGNYTLTINQNSNSVYMASIDDGSGATNSIENICLEEDEATKRISSIVCTYSEVASDLDLPLVITFDKSKGSVRKIISNGVEILPASGDGILCFDISPTRGDKTSKVQLITGTGKHTIGDF